MKICVPFIVAVVFLSPSLHFSLEAKTSEIQHKSSLASRAKQWISNNKKVTTSIVVGFVASIAYATFMTKNHRAKRLSGTSEQLAELQENLRTAEARNAAALERVRVAHDNIAAARNATTIEELRIAQNNFRAMGLFMGSREETSTRTRRTIFTLDEDNAATGPQHLRQQREVRDMAQDRNPFRSVLSDAERIAQGALAAAKIRAMNVDDMVRSITQNS